MARSNVLRCGIAGAVGEQSRVIFMTSAFVLEPTLFGAEFIEATRDDCFEIGRIVRVWVPTRLCAKKQCHTRWLRASI
jgi:hypothetical protein